MKADSDAPHRTCIATRKVRPQTELLRVVVGEKRADVAVILPDPHRKLPGRGAWIQPTVQALEQAEQRKAFQRAFRVSTPVDTGQVRAYLTGPTM